MVNLFFKDFFIPHSGNNYKAKLLHHATLLLLTFFILSSTFFLNTLNRRFPQVLGISSNITSEQLLTLLNQKRRENNLSNLNLNPELSSAAFSKANDMLSKNYWAHTSPEGKTPWEFIKESGYIYVYAGENLARGFTTSSDVTTAWIESPSHKANMLSGNYSDVGFAVVTGSLEGQETVLVVQEFGSKSLASLPSANNDQKTIAHQSVPVENPQDNVVEDPKVLQEQDKFGNELFAGAKAVNNPKVDSADLTSNISMILIGLVVFALIAEMIILERRKVLNFAKHNPDHIMFLLSILILIFILGKGSIL